MPTSKSARFCLLAATAILSRSSFERVFTSFFCKEKRNSSKEFAHKKMLLRATPTVASTSLSSTRRGRRDARGTGTDRLRRGFRKGQRERSRVLLRAKDDDSEEEKFVPIDYDSENCPGETAEGRFGPDAILLVGFTPTEKRVVREMLNDMGADFIDLITCTKEMYEKMTLKECMEEKQEGKEVFSVAGMKTKIVIMSGMIGAEVVSVVDAFHESQFKDSAPAFACAVPNSWEKPIKQTVEEISGDHEEALKDRGSAR